MLIGIEEKLKFSFRRMALWHFVKLYRLVLLSLLFCFCRQDLGLLLRDKKSSASPRKNTLLSSAKIFSDINGDGYDDILTGAYGNGDPAQSGIAYVLYGSANGITPPTLNNCVYPNCTEIENPLDENAGIPFAGAYAIAGDVNGDGYADIVIAAQQNGVANTPAGMAGDRGAVYVFYGSATGITAHVLDAGASSYVCTGPPDCTMIQNPRNSADNFGDSVSAAGDINRDGYADILVGASGASTVYIFYGSASGVTYRPFTGSADACGLPSCTMFASPNVIASFGFDVAYAGDVDGNDYPDILISATGGNGLAYVYYGTQSGIASRPTVGYSCTGIADGCTEIRNPESVAIDFGISVSAGDFNSDGMTDVVIGAKKADDGGNLVGAAFMYLGSTTGVPHHADASGVYVCAGACIAIRNPATEAFGDFGVTVSNLGDVNGDGFADLVVGAQNNEPDGTADDRGIAYVYYGKIAGLTAHPVASGAYTCSGYPDCTELRNPRADANSQFGGFATSAGDVNGDGFADFWIGSIQDGPSSEGMLFIYHGRASGIIQHTSAAGSHACPGTSDCTAVANPRNYLGSFGAGR